MNFDDFEPRQDFFPYFPEWQGKTVTLGCAEIGVSAFAVKR